MRYGVRSTGSSPLNEGTVSVVNPAADSASLNAIMA
jgi:hypothetical protein